jgi:predicted transcriptional regulator of viral defense system
MTPFENIGNIPFDVNVLSTVFPNNKHINEKARTLEKNGQIIRLKKGMYVASQMETGKEL